MTALERIIGALGPPFTPRSRRRTILVVALAAVTLGAGFALRQAHHNPNDPIVGLFVLPVVYVSLELGIVPGLACGAVAYGLFIAWIAIDDIDVSIVGHLSRLVVLVAAALFVGSIASRLRSALDQARRSEERIAAIVDYSSDALMSSDEEGRILGWNPAAERIFGWRAEEVLGKRLADVAIPKPLRDVYREGLRRFLEAGDRSLIGQRVEARGLHRDGHEFPIEIAISAVKETEGWIFHAFAHDISKRKEEDRAQRHLAAVVEASPDAIISSTRDGEIIAWNRGAERLYGYTAQEALGMSVYDLQPHDRPYQTWIVEQAGSGESVEALETERVAKGGRKVDVSLTVFPVRDAEGRVVAITSITRDISDRKRAEHYLDAQFQASRTLAEIGGAAPAGLAILPIVAEGGSWLGAAYWSAAEDGSQLRCDRTWVAAHVRGLDLPIKEGAVREASGNVREPAWVISAPAEVQPTATDASQHGFETSVWIPITADNELFGAFQFLDRRSRERDPELISALMAIANQTGNHLKRRQAERDAERAKDEFFALVSHELRTPLTSIIGYGDLLAESESERLSEEGRGFVDVVRRNAQREMRLVGDLLLLVRIQEGKFDVELEDADLQPIVDEAVEASRPVARERGIALSHETRSVHTSRADIHRLSQVVDNLLSNAIKFTPEGGRIDVRLVSSNGIAAIEVEDSGIGIPDAEQERLFERLYRAPSATAAQISGLGLGLTIAKAIVDAHGGAIRVESTEGVGTKVRVELPLDEAPR